MLSKPARANCRKRDARSVRVARNYQPSASAVVTYLAQVFVEGGIPPETSTVVCGLCGEDLQGVEQHQVQVVGRRMLWATLFLDLPFPPLALFCCGARSLLHVVCHTAWLYKATFSYTEGYSPTSEEKELMSQINLSTNGHGKLAGKKAA